jgi:O-antigen chain-terminating methyltransferase
MTRLPNWTDVRGDRECVRGFQRKYLRWFEGARLVLDVGCGRGEFLELLREAGIDGRGIDSSEALVAHCRSQGLAVERAGVLDFLARTQERFDGIFCSHVVEHMAPKEVAASLGGFRRVLARGGRLVLVTPNPRSLYVMTELFWLDATHVRPYPLALLRRLLEERGFRVLASGGDPDTVPDLARGSVVGPLLRALAPSIVRDWFLGADDNFLVAEVPAGDDATNV